MNDPLQDANRRIAQLELELRMFKDGMISVQIHTMSERIAELEEALREIASDPSQNILSDKHRKLLEKGTGE